MKKYNGIDIDYGENLAEIEAYDRSLRVDDDESFEEQIIEIMEEDNSMIRNDDIRYTEGMERDMIGYVPVNLETGEIIDDEISSDED